MCFYFESISSLCWMKCTSLMSKDTKSWTVLFRNTPPSDRVYMWGSGNPHVHVKYWHLWWKRKKKLSERGRWRKGDWNRKSSWPPVTVTLQDINFDLNILWTYISKRFSIEGRQRQTQTLLKARLFGSRWNSNYMLISILHRRSNENIYVTEMNGAQYTGCHAIRLTPHQLSSNHTEHHWNHLATP